MGCKLLERTGRWEDKLAKVTSQKREKMRQKKKGHLSTKHNLLQLPALCATGRWFSLSTPISSTNLRTDRHNITEILLKVALNSINQTIL